MDRKSKARATGAELLRQHRRVLIDLARFAAESFDLRSFIDDAVQRVATALEIDHVKLLRYRPDHADLFLEAGVGWNPGVVGSAAFPTDLASPVGRAFQTAQPVMVADLSETDEIIASEVLRAHGIVSLLNVPVLTDGAVWGVIEVDSTKLRGFSPDSISFMAAVASLVGLVIQRTEAEAGRAAAAAAAAQEVLRRELLLREMQHRVKNNFQTILGMISLRARDFPLEEGRALARKMADAIMAMSLAHDQLSPTRTGEIVGLANYLRALVASFVVTADSIAIEAVCDDVNVSIEQAVPIGLIVNELLTNSIKHAFGSNGGAVRVELHAVGRPGAAMLLVSDNGKGLPADAKEGSGHKLVRALADQIRGELTQQSSEKGVVTRLFFNPRTR